MQSTILNMASFKLKAQNIEPDPYLDGINLENCSISISVFPDDNFSIHFSSLLFMTDQLKSQISDLSNLNIDSNFGPTGCDFQLSIKRDTLSVKTAVKIDRGQLEDGYELKANIFSANEDPEILKKFYEHLLSRTV